MKVRHRPHPDCLGQKAGANNHSPKMRGVSETDPTRRPKLYTNTGFDGKVDETTSSKEAQLVRKTAYDLARREDLTRWGYPIITTNTP